MEEEVANAVETILSSDHVVVVDGGSLVAETEEFSDALGQVPA